MIKVLGRLSQNYHKNNISVSEDQLRELYKEIISFEENKEKCINMLINMADEYFALIDEIYNWAYLNNNLTEQICNSQIKGLNARGKIDESIILVENMKSFNLLPHVRTFLLFFTQSQNMDNMNEKQFVTILNLIKSYNILPTTELFSYLIKYFITEKTYLSELVEWSSQYCNHLNLDVTSNIISPNIISPNTIISNATVLDGVCQSCYTQLKKIDLTSDQRNMMLKSVFDSNIKNGIERWIQTRDYKFVIDGANVAHYNNSPFNVNKIINCINTINKNYNNPKIFVIFSVCRKKQTHSLQSKWGNVDVFYSKSGTNDDLSWLYAAIYYPNIWCITNDQMRDHVYYRFTETVGRNVIDLWMEQQIVTFSFTNLGCELNVPLSYSIRPQVNDIFVHIPLDNNNNKWYCGKL